MAIYPVKYLQYANNMFCNKPSTINNTPDECNFSYEYFDFLKAVRVAEIDGKYYTVKYDTSHPNHGPFGNPYIEKEGDAYPVTCRGEVVNTQINLNGEIIDYQAVNQICSVEI